MRLRYDGLPAASRRNGQSEGSKGVPSRSFARPASQKPSPTTPPMLLSGSFASTRAAAAP